MRKCRIGTAKFFTLLLLLYRTSVKSQGRKHSLRRLCDKVKENIVNPAEQVVFISHGDCEDEARTLADMIRRDVGVKDVQISFIGPIVGSHSGPGTLAVFFMSRGR